MTHAISITMDDEWWGELFPQNEMEHSCRVLLGTCMSNKFSFDMPDIFSAAISVHV